MADENKPAFYPRVGRTIAKNFRSAQPPAFVEDPRAMDLPQYGDVDLSVPSKENLEMARRMAERDAQLKRQQEADRSPLEKLAGGIQAGRFLGSALTQGINSIPTRIFKGDEAADKFMQERLYKPEQPLAYEYAGDVGDFLEKLETEYKIPPVLPEAVALQFLSGPATSQAMKAAGKGVERAGMALERGMEPVVKGALERGGLPREMAMAMGANTQANVMKPSGKGANWLGGKRGSVEAQLGKMKMADYTTPEQMTELQKSIDTAKRIMGDDPEVQRAVNQMENELSTAKRNNAINSWIDSNLRNYVKNQMATPDDPVRKLAEEGILHMAPYGEQGVVSSRLMNKRMGLGQDPLGMGRSDPARFWERMSDISVDAYPAGSYKYGSLDESILADNPWLQKVPDDTMIYSGKGLSGDLGFDHIIDVLRQDVREGRIRPEQLNKVSMEQAVRRVHEYDQEMAKKMAEAQVKATEGMPVYKEYPEGYKWIELTTPEPKIPEGSVFEEYNGMQRLFGPNGESLSVGATKEEATKLYKRQEREKQLEEALQYEGNTMGHCVGGYCPDVLEGRTRIFSLRDTKGEPHVTVEVQPNQHLDYNSWFNKQPEEIQNKIAQRRLQDKNHDIYEGPEYLAAREALAPRIVQIKGKQNRAPKEDYLPYVQDFVRSGNWSQVGDLQNTGLIRKSDLIDKFSPDELDAIGAGEFLTKGEHDDLLLKALRPPAEGMKRGGVVISNNPDTMMLEVNNQKMKNGVPAYGGAGAVLKEGLKAVKPPKIEVPIRFPVSRGPSIPEIRAMAERMAPQVMGEFVRAAPTPSNPKPSTSVIGKTQKQFEREKTLPIEYENIKPEVTPEEFDYAKKKGALLIGAQGDVTPGNRMLMSIDEQPLSVPVHLQAGPEWELYNPTAWAASDQMAKTYMKRAGQAAEAYDADPYLHYHKMTPDANFYAMHHLNSVLGHLRPEELMLRDPKLYQQMVEEIRTRDVGYGKHPEFEGFEDPLNLQIHAQMDPNFRRHLSAIFNGPKFTERYGLNSGQDVLAATSLPELRDLEAGASGYAVVPLDVKAPLKHFGAESQTYDTGFPKAGPSGRSKYPSPYQLIYRDTLNWMKENPSENKSSEFGRMNMIVPKQQIDNELIEAIGEYQRRMKELTGKKKGGAVKKAAGGAITGDDLILEERPL